MFEDNLNTLSNELIIFQLFVIIKTLTLIRDYVYFKPFFFILYTVKILNNVEVAPNVHLFYFNLFKI